MNKLQETIKMGHRSSRHFSNSPDEHSKDETIDCQAELMSKEKQKLLRL